MVSKTTLFLSNLPQRPKNKQNYIKTLLKHFNPNNEYCDHITNLPDQRFSMTKEVPLLDERLGIVSISRPQSVQFKNKCFITFINEESSTRFIKKFQHVKIMGRCIKIQFAKKRSYMEVFNDNPRLLNKVLKIKKTKRLNSINDPLNLKRKLRRLRCKLRAKHDLSQEQRDQIVEEYRIKLIKASNVSQRNVNGDDKKVIKSKKRQKSIDSTRQINKLEKPSSKVQNKINVSENPPNKTLLIQNIPINIDENQLINIFQNEGFVEIRMVPVRHLAFIEYDSIESAKHVLNRLGNTYRINDETDQQVSIGYAK